METTTIETQETGRLTVKSAGRTLKGSSNTMSGEYICCVNYSGPGRVRGLYGIADGVKGERGAASEFAIETLKKSFRHIRESDSVNGSNLLPGCLEEVHSTLINSKTGAENGEAAAVMICGYIEGDTAHIALAGGGAAYILENGKISRITQDTGIPDLEKTEPDLLQNGQTPVGYTKTSFRPSFVSQRLKPDSTLIFCSNGLLMRLNSLTIQEKIHTAGSIDEAAELIISEARGRDGSDDIGIVLARLEAPAEQKKPAFPISIKYPLGIYVFKYFAVTVLIATLAFLILAGTGNMRNENATAKKTGGNQAAAAFNIENIKIAGVKSAGPSGAIQNSAKLHLRTDPANALVFVDGVQQTGASPFDITVPAGRQVVLQVESPAFEPYDEKIMLVKDTTTEKTVALRPGRPKNGSLLVICRPRCDSMEFDGRSIGGFPKDEVMIREIAPGDHRIKGSLADESEGRSLRIVSGITQSIVMRFANEKINLPAQPGVEKQSAPQQESPADIVRTQPENDNGNLEQIKKPSVISPENNSSPAVSDAFFVIDTNVPNCNVMVLKDNNLELTGFSGTRYDVKPGRYTIQVSKSGYGDEQRDIVLDKEYQVIHINLKRQ